MPSVPREAPPLLLFDAEASGHHPEYVRHLLKGLAAQMPDTPVVLAVPQEMLDVHPELTSYGATAAPLPTPGPADNPWEASQSRWTALAETVRVHQPRGVLLLYADILLPTLARHRRLPGHPHLATVHFRPPVRQPGDSLRDRVRDVVKRHHLRRLFRHPDMRAAFSLDPRAVPALRAQARGVSVFPLADPVPAPTLTAGEQDEARQRLRDEFGAGDRHLMVLFGALDQRKGIFETLDAVRRLPEAAAARLAVAFVGPVHPADAKAFAQDVAAAEAGTRARLVVRDGFVKDGREIEATLGAADTVLLPYQRHIGSSAVLIRAAALERPTIAQDIGLVGEWTRAHHLGRDVDTTDPAALAQAMQDAIEAPRRAFDPAAATAFAAAHTPEAFVATLMEGIHRTLTQA